MLPDLFRRLKPLHGQKIDRLWIAYQLGTEEDRRAIEAALTVLAVKEQGIAIGNERITLEPPPSDVSTIGQVTLGTIDYPGMTPYPVRLSYNELLRHLFLLGPSGTGKSTFIIGILRQLLRDRVPFWCIDFKRNYRCLLRDQHGMNVLVLSVGRNLVPLQVNMLAPPAGVERNEWIEALADIISTAYLLLHGARNVLKTALGASITTMREARDLLASELAKARSGSRRYGWLESAHRALDELTKGPLGETLCATNPMPLADLLPTTTVFELQGLGDDQKSCVCLYLLQYVLLFRKHQADQREVLHHVLVFDEAHNVFRKERIGELGVPSRLAREVREYGEAIISATQQADVADSLIANSGTKIILRTDYPKDVDFASKLLQIEPRWVTKVPMGSAVIRLPTRYYQSFLIAFAEQPLKNTLITDAMVQERYAQWAQQLIKKRAQDPALGEELAKLNDLARRTLGGRVPLDVVLALDDLLSDAPTARPATPAIEHADAVDDKESLLVRDIAQFPISTVTERYARLHWNPKVGNAIKDRLLARGLLAFELLAVHQGRVKLLTLTEGGVAYAREHGITMTSLGRAGLEHEFWRQRIKERCEARGYTVTREYHLGNGHRVDLLAVTGNRRVLIEIETGKSEVIANARKCDGHGTLVVFFTSKEAWHTHHEQLPPGTTSVHPDTLGTLHALLKRISPPETA